MQELTPKTLIIRFSSVGDIVLSSLLIRALRKHNPASPIDFLVKNQYAGLVRDNPSLARVIEFPRKGTLTDLIALRRRIRRENYGFIVDIHGSLRSRFLTAGTRNVARVNKRTLARFLLVRFGWDFYPKLGGSPSVALRYLEAARSSGAVDDGKGLDFFVPENAARAASAMLEQERLGPGLPIIGVCPSAKHATKMWLSERFAESASTLARDHGAAIVIFGSGDERIRCEQIAVLARTLAPASRVVNLAGRLTLTETGAVMDRCSVVLTNDSGLMHVAAARKRPLVAIFGSTTCQLGFFPFGTRATVVEETLGCRPCSHIGRSACPKRHFKCMRDVTTQQVVRAATRLLQGEPDAPLA